MSNETYLLVFSILLVVGLISNHFILSDENYTSNVFNIVIVTMIWPISSLAFAAFILLIVFILLFHYLECSINWARKILVYHFKHKRQIEALNEKEGGDWYYDEQTNSYRDFMTDRRYYNAPRKI